MISALNTSLKPLSFHAKKSVESKDKNPISRAGEASKLTAAAAVGGLALGGKILLELFEDGLVGTEIFDKAKSMVDKNRKDLTGGKKYLMYAGATGALFVGFMAAVSVIYTIYKSPEISYKSKVNAFAKGKDMDLYVKGNNVEKELYDQMNDKAKNATPEEKEKLKQQYLKLRAAKNQVPEFVKNNN